MRMHYSLNLAAICWLCASLPAAAAMVVPDCAGAVEVAQAQLVRVERNGALILPDGRAALLEGIRLPSGQEPLAGAAWDQLRALAMAAPLTLTATRPKEDRYDRVRVQAFTLTKSGTTAWLQMELLRRGLARVAIAPDRSECAPDFYETEAAARDANTGLWAIPAYAVRTPQTVKNDMGSFQIVEGRIVSVGRRDGRLFFDFSSGRGFAAMVAPDYAKAFRDLEPAVEEMEGRRARVRGMVGDYGGRTVITLTNPAQIELLK